MDDILEIIFELILDGSLEISKNKKVSKWIRYPAIALISLFFMAVIFILIYITLISIEENTLLSIFFGALTIFFIVMSYIKFKKEYLSRKKDK